MRMPPARSAPGRENVRGAGREAWLSMVLDAASAPCTARTGLQARQPAEPGSGLFVLSSGGPEWIGGATVLRPSSRTAERVDSAPS